MSFTNSPNMGFPVPAVGNESGPQYATDVNQALLTLDSHNHSPGQGVPIGSQGINLQSDLSYNVNNAIGLRSVRFISTTASSGTDIGALYVKGVDLFYNDLNANIVRLTLNGGLASTSIFVGVISTTAIISSNAGVPASSGFIRMVNNSDFVSWRNAANSGDDKVYFDNADTFQVIGGGGLQTHTLKLVDLVGGKILSQKAAQPTSGYSVRWPINPPIATSALVSMDAAGNLSPAPGFIDTKLVLSGGIYPASTANAWLNAVTNSALTIVDANTGSHFPIIVSQNTSQTGLMFVRGGIDSNGNLSAGEGFSSAKTGTGLYTITFTAVFGDLPVITVSGSDTNLTNPIASLYNISSSAFSAKVFTDTGTAGNFGINFHAIGQRA